jgi:hypothetical protein
MRLRRCVFLVFFVSGAALIAAANSPWQTKDFKDWTKEDALLLLTDSPWAKRLPMPASGRPGVVVIEPGSSVSSPPAASLGNPSNTTTGANMSLPSIGGSNGPADPNGTHNLPTTPTQSGISANAGAPSPPTTVTIIWASAAPIRLAVLKLHSGANAPTETEIARASSVRQHYVLAVVGLPPPEDGSDPKALAAHAYLSAKGKPPLVASDSDYKKIGNSDVYFFRFDRSSFPLSAQDRDVEFKATFGKIEIKKKFELSEMQYKGQFAL